MSTQAIECGWRCRKCGEARIWEVEVELVTDDGLNSSEDVRRLGLATFSARAERDATYREHAERCGHDTMKVIGTHIAVKPALT